MIVPDMTLNKLMTKFSNAGVLGNADYLFIDIAHSSTLTQSGSNW